MEVFTWAFVNEAKLWQQYGVKLSCDFHVFYSEVDVIKATRSHLQYSFNFRDGSMTG